MRAKQDTPYGYCQCGCGEKAPVSKRNRPDIGHVKGEPIRFIRGHSSRTPARDGMKWCHTCNKELPVSSFGRRADRGPGALRSKCAGCQAEARQEWVERTGWRAPVRKLTPEQAERNRQRVKDWNARYPQKRRLAAMRDQHRRRGAPFSPEDREYAEEVLAGDPCSYCGCRDKITIDHVVPVSMGGTSHWTNLTAACLACNSGKGPKALLTFLLDRAA